MSVREVSWKNDAKQVAQKLAVTFFKWSSSAQATVLSGGGTKDVDAVVQVQSTGIGHPIVKVTLSRLYGNTSNIWEVVAVKTDGLSVTSPQNGSLLTSPVTVTGTGNAFEGQVGTVYILDHLLTTIGQAPAMGSGMGPTAFSAKVDYTSTFKGGAQEGVVALYSTSAADGGINAVTLLKGLLSA